MLYEKVNNNVCGFLLENLIRLPREMEITRHMLNVIEFHIRWPQENHSSPQEATKIRKPFYQLRWKSTELLPPACNVKSAVTNYSHMFPWPGQKSKLRCWKMRSCVTALRKINNARTRTLHVNLHVY